MSWLWIGLAFATDTALYSQVSTLTLPAEGAAVIELGEASMLPNSQDVVLLDAQGVERPWVMLDSDQTSERRWSRVPFEPIWDDVPHLRGLRIDTRAYGHTIDRIELQVGGLWDLDSWPRDGGAWVLPIEVHDSQGRQVAEGLLWRAHIAHEDRANDVIEVPELPPGVYEVTTPRRHVRWEGLRVSSGADLGVPELELSLPVTGPEPAGLGRSRYVVQLPASGVQLRELSLQVEDERFLRSLEVYSPAFDGTGTLGVQLLGRGSVERLQLGGASIDAVDIPLEAVAGNRLELLVQDGRDRPLSLSRVVVKGQGRRLLVHDAGPGPHRLYAAPLEPQRGRHDLSHALIELVELDPPLVAGLDWRPNPDHDPRSGLPASLLRAAPLEREERVEAELIAPLVGRPTRWVLSPEVISASSESQAELRIVDGEGRQVPFLRDSGTLRQLDVTVARTEVGSATLLTLTSPQDKWLSSVVLESSDPAFSRQARVELGGGASFYREPGEPEPRAELRVSRTDDANEVLVWIENDDDLPLQDLRVQLWGYAPALVAIAPEQATLVLGEPLSSPSYDLRHFGSRLLQGRLEQGTVGPVLAEQPRLPAPGQGLWTGLGIAALALGLLGLAWTLVKAPAPGQQDEGD
jgi:hypothetical protein